MTQEQNDIFYTASIMEQTARFTKNRLSHVADRIGIEGARKIYQFAEVSHCMPFSQVVDELVSDFKIPTGTFQPEVQDGGKIPSASEIGKVYMRLVEDAEPNPDKWPDALIAILKSKISDWMSDYRSAFYYSPRDYIFDSYQEILKKR